MPLHSRQAAPNAAVAAAANKQNHIGIGSLRERLPITQHVRCKQHQTPLLVL
jgi:hypothetical protein